MKLLFEELDSSSLPICFPFAHTPFIAVNSLYVLLSKTLQCCACLNYMQDPSHELHGPRCCSPGLLQWGSWPLTASKSMSLQFGCFKKTNKLGCAYAVFNKVSTVSKFTFVYLARVNFTGLSAGRMLYRISSRGHQYGDLGLKKCAYTQFIFLMYQSRLNIPWFFILKYYISTHTYTNQSVTMCYTNPLKQRFSYWGGSNNCN